MSSASEALPLRVQTGECFAGKYRIEGVLGRGGMSVVLAALHQTLNQKVALKLLSTPRDVHPDAVGRFLREARAAAALRSEYSARVVDVDVDPLGRHYIVMEHLDGLDLGEVLLRDAVLPVETCVGYLLHACEAIAEAHHLGIIHRDLKPGNLFLTQRVDGTPLIKVLDFGVSKLVVPARDATDSLASAANTLLGTPQYMSPDQIRTPEAIDGRSDVWGLGVILYELLTKRAPFTGDTVPDVLAAVLMSEPRAPSVLRPDVPSGLSEVVLRCLKKDVGARHQNVGELARALRRWAPLWALDAADRAARISRSDAGSPGSAAAGEEVVPPAEWTSEPRSSDPRTQRRWRSLAAGAAAAPVLAWLASSIARVNDMGPERAPAQGLAAAPVAVPEARAPRPDVRILPDSAPVPAMPSLSASERIDAPVEPSEAAAPHRARTVKKRGVSAPRKPTHPAPPADPLSSRR